MSYRRAGVLTILGAVSLLFLVGISGASEPLEELCLGCHSALEGRLQAPTKDWSESVHKRAGYSCEECHGGYDLANQHMADPSVVKPRIFRGKDLPAMCARCHTDPAVMRKYNLRLDQYPLYKTTAHWKALQAGNDRAATCISCHGVHGIRKKTDPKAPVYRDNIPNTCGQCHENPKIVGKARAVVEPYWAGVHGQILQGKVPGKNPAAAPVCTDCHGVHRLHLFSTPKEEISACASCHAGVAKQFRQSLHVKFLGEGQALRCSDCHDPHKNTTPTVAMLEGNDEGHCGSCHTEPTGRPLRMASSMREAILVVQKLIGLIEEGLEAVEHAGRFNDDWIAGLEDVKTAFKEIGPVVHSLDLVRVKETASKAEARARSLHKEILTFREDLRTRRLGLFVALGIILFNIVIVYLKLRSLPTGKD